MSRRSQIDERVQYVLRTFSPEKKTFALFDEGKALLSRAMAGAGILALAHAGVHNRPETKGANEYILKVSCVPYGEDRCFQTEAALKSANRRRCTKPPASFWFAARASE